MNYELRIKNQEVCLEAGFASNVLRSMFYVLISLFSFSFFLIPQSASAAPIENMERSAGILVYASSTASNANKDIYFREYASSSNSFTATSTVGVTISSPPRWIRVKTSPIKAEAIVGVLDLSGTLHILCYEKTTRTWTEDWSVSVVGTGTTTKFDIAYEGTSGRAVVLYSTGAASTNELAYRTKASSVSCGSGNWSSATNYNPSSTSGQIGWILLAETATTSTNLIAAAWLDSNRKASSAIWDATANSGAGGWGNEPTLAHERTVDMVSVAQDIDPFDIVYESMSKDVFVAMARAEGAAGTSGLVYRQCTGGTASCSWSSTTTPGSGAPADGSEYLDLSANLYTNEIALSTIGAASGDGGAGNWSGQAFTGQTDVDINGIAAVAAGRRAVAAVYLSTSTRISDPLNHSRVHIYNESTANTDWYYSAGTTTTLSVQTDFDMIPDMGTTKARVETYQDTFYPIAMLVQTDTGEQLRASRVAKDWEDGTVTFSNSDGGPLSRSTSSFQAFSFAFWRYPSMPSFENAGWRLYAETQSTAGVGTYLGPPNTLITLATSSGTFRLRWLVRAKNSSATTSLSSFKIQYADRGLYGSCGEIPSGSFADVGAGTPIAFNDGSGTDRATLTANSADPTAGSETVVDQINIETNTFGVGTRTPGGQNLKYDFALKDNGATEDSIYCLRLTNTDSNLNVTASTTIPGYGYPEVRIKPREKGGTNTGGASETGLSSQVKTVYTADDTFAVPAGITSITVKAWGGGGGGGAGGVDTSSDGANGAGAGFAQATISVTPEETLTIKVGGGGGGGNTSVTTGGTGGSNGGGNGGASQQTSSGSGGGGGGYSGVLRSGTELVIAAGGGGGGGADNGAGITSGAGGVGGDTTGTAGTTISSGSTLSGGGGGGTPSAGGALGSSGGNCTLATTPTAGASLAGGIGGAESTSNSPGGGGGGAGHFGGGGASPGCGLGAGGGGGGSSYTTGTDVVNTPGSTTSAGNNTDEDYAGDAGAGGAGGQDDANGTAGNPGRVVIIYGQYTAVTGGGITGGSGSEGGGSGGTVGGGGAGGGGASE